MHNRPLEQLPPQHNALNPPGDSTPAPRRRTHARSWRMEGDVSSVPYVQRLVVTARQARLQEEGHPAIHPTLLAGMRAQVAGASRWRRPWRLKPIKCGNVTAYESTLPHGEPQKGGASSVAPTPVLRRRPACPWN